MNMQKKMIKMITMNMQKKMIMMNTMNMQKKKNTMKFYVHHELPTATGGANLWARRDFKKRARNDYGVPLTEAGIGSALRGRIRRHAAVAKKEDDEHAAAIARDGASWKADISLSKLGYTTANGPS